MKKTAMRIRYRPNGIKQAKIVFVVLLLLGITGMPGMAIALPGMDSAVSVRYERLGHELMCSCGCNSVLLECNHLGCTAREQMRGELRNTLGGGTDEQILAGFVKKYGSVVLAAPTHKGFDRVAWIVPYLALLLGLAGVSVLVRLWMCRRGAKPALAVSQIDDPQIKKYCHQIQEETKL